MTLSGDLEHLPIVDVIQLLHSSRKSGILCVRSRKGESRLVFKEGYIVSASHLNNSVRIGQILVERGVISEQVLEKTLREQEQAGGARKPIIVILVEQGLVQEQQAYQALEYLIEKTLVEILTWKKGSFELEAGDTTSSDGYRYYPARMSREINVDTQSVLMEALRMYDEKVRDGLLPQDEEDHFLLSADDLGLGGLEADEAVPGFAPDPAPAMAEPADETAAVLRSLQQEMARLQGAAGVPEVALALLARAAEIFERSVTLVVRQGELVAEKGIGVGEPGRSPSPPLGFRVPVSPGSALGRAVAAGTPFYGAADAAGISAIFSAIGAPASPSILLLPLRSGGRTVSVTYADFGSREPVPVRVEALEILAAHAGCLVENILYRKRIARGA
ncbi:MAG TPA: DUF4388 domain-containing protein [Verrucomicrobiae bacterium]|nr:DUF4388 domain-containing protein [Verrucomicrobiae bacterium]